MRRFKRFLTLLLLVIPVSLMGASVKISTDAAGGKVEVGETFHIIIESTNNPGGNLEVTQMPPGVKKVYQSQQSESRVTTVNGRTEMTNTTKLILTCKGEIPGSYKFGPVSLNGIKSNVVAYQVVPANGNSGGNSSSGNQGRSSGAFDPNTYDPNAAPLFVGKGNEEMYLRAQVNKTTAYEQEAIEYVVKLYTTYDIIKFMGAAAAPKFEGFVIEESDDVSKSLTRESINGKTYATAVIARYIIFPQKSGKLKILGNTYTVSTDAKQYYHDPYFQGMTVRYPIQLNVTPNDVEINVKPLPTPIPANFTGGVGQFRLSTSMPNKNLTTNSPGQIIYSFEGSGNIKYLTMPDLATYFPSSLEVFSPENSVDAKVGSSNVSGISKFDFSILPRETGNFTIPSIEFTYFDPADGQYKTLRSEAYNISVSMGESSSKSQKALAFDPDLLPAGIQSENPGYPYVYTWYFWLWFIIPAGIFIFALGSYHKYLRDHEDITQLRSKKANKMALKRLAKAYQCYKNHQESQFYDEMLAALWGYLGDKLKMPVSELNRNNVSEEFKKHGVKESTFMPIINLIDECEYAKYTPVERDANMRQLYSDAVETLAKVESEYDKEKGVKEEDPEEDDMSNADNYVNTMDASSASHEDAGQPSHKSEKTDNSESSLK